ncbi:MAG: DUF4102 domain-containing protein [Betaproteobacteria bacterium]|nr:DUF4102 domain-containing protein [Betaproteobacteria bacterium]
MGFVARDKGLLSDLQIRHWIKAGTPLAKTDGNGLTFTLSAAGAAGWILRYSHGGRRRELSIGRYPDISLADARGIATIKRAEIMQGGNPAADKQKAKSIAAKDWTARTGPRTTGPRSSGGWLRARRWKPWRHLKRIENRLGALTVRDRGIGRNCADRGQRADLGRGQYAADHHQMPVPLSLGKAW